jgi:hypothetical protein
VAIKVLKSKSIEGRKYLAVLNHVLPLVPKDFGYIAAIFHCFNNLLDKSEIGKAVANTGLGKYIMWNHRAKPSVIETLRTPKESSYASNY